MRKYAIVPKFATEVEEAEWWDQQMDTVGENLIEAIENGTAHRGGPAALSEERRRALAAIAAAKTFMASLTEEDREHFHRLAVKAGVDDETYVQRALLKVLASELAA
jgi:hypothetical protein